MNDQLINRVASSGLITIKLEDYFPPYDIISLDLKDYLFRGLILKEMDFRAAMKDYHWDSVNGKLLTVFCSADAIIPTWAYMLVAQHATPHVHSVYYGTKEECIRTWFSLRIKEMDAEEYRDAKLVIKGCSEKEVPASAYLEITAKLKEVASSIMFGEPCSTVPIFKRPKN